MTKRQFAHKYGIDYQMVQTASSRSAHNGAHYRTRNDEYDERDLAAAVWAELEYSLQWHLELADRYTGILERLQEIAPKPARDAMLEARRKIKTLRGETADSQAM